MPDKPTEASNEEKQGLILDRDGKGNVVDLEILDASQRTDSPRSVEYSIPG